MRRSLAVLFILAALLCGAVISRGAWAAEPAPGDACSPDGIFTRAGGPETSGVVTFMVCQGSVWKAIMSSNASGQVTKIGNQTCATGEILKFDGAKYACSADLGSPSIGIGLVVGGPANTALTNGRFQPLVLGANNSATEGPTQQPVGTAGTFSSFCLRTTAAQGATGSTLTLRKNGVNTALAVTIPGSAAAGTYCNVGSTASFAAGDLTSVAVTGANTATISGWSVAFFGSTCADMTPDLYDFTDLINQATSTQVTSNIAQITGVGCTVTGSVSGAAGGPQMRVCSTSNCSSVLFDWTTAAPVSNNDYVQLRMTTSATGGDPRTAAITIGASGDGWTVTPTGDCAGSPAVGTVCADGTIYAGLSPDGSEKMFTTHCDYGQTWDGTACTGSRSSLSWNNGTNNWTTTGYTSGTTGEANTYGLDNISDAGAVYNAAHACASATDNGQNDWYLPGLQEMELVYANRAAIGNIQAGARYWESVELSNQDAYADCSDIGYSCTESKTNGHYFRCVRRANNWTPPGATPTDCTLASPTIGGECSDAGHLGEVYAGLSPDGNEKMFTTHCDYGQTWSGTGCTGSAQSSAWNNGTTNWTTTGYTSFNTGKSNTDGLVNSSDAGAPYGAANMCDGLTANGKTDWYLPALNEMEVMWSNRTQIGNFVPGWRYWESTEYSNSAAKAWCPDQGYSCNVNKDTTYTFRCVRRD